MHDLIRCMAEECPPCPFGVASATKNSRRRNAFSTIACRVADLSNVYDGHCKVITALDTPCVDARCARYTVPREISPAQHAEAQRSRAPTFSTRVSFSTFQRNATCHAKRCCHTSSRRKWNATQRGGAQKRDILVLDAGR